MNAWAQSEGQPGLGYIFFRDGRGGGARSPRISVPSGPRRSGPSSDCGRRCRLLRRRDCRSEFAAFAGQARVKIGSELELTAKDRSSSAGSSISRCMSGTRRRSGSTSRTTRSPCRKAGWRRSRRKDPLDILAYQYDIVCNGVELSSGAIRNHKPEIMEKAFAIAGYPKDELEKRFGGMLRALHYGAPPHGGIAPGIDRIVMLLCGEENLRAGDDVPDEPAGRGPADGRAVRGVAEAIERAAYSRRAAGRRVNDAAKPSSRLGHSNCCLNVRVIP